MLLSTGRNRELWTKRLLDLELLLKYLCGHSYSLSETVSLEVQKRGGSETAEATWYGTQIYDVMETLYDGV